MSDSTTAIVLLGHGSRLEPARRSMEALAGRVAAMLGETPVEVAYLQMAKPELEEAVAQCVGRGARRVAVVPVFLFPGAHVLEDIPTALEGLRERYPGVEITLAALLGDHPRVAQAVADRAREAMA